MDACDTCGGQIKHWQRRNRTRCGSCNTKLRRMRHKLAGIKLLGGKCIHCGVKATNENFTMFSFHHTNSDTKSFNIGSQLNKAWSVVKPEIEKCVLLCSNCHVIEHSRFGELVFIEAALNYKGRVDIWLD